MKRIYLQSEVFKRIMEKNTNMNSRLWRTISDFTETECQKMKVLYETLRTFQSNWTHSLSCEWMKVQLSTRSNFESKKSWNKVENIKKEVSLMIKRWSIQLSWRNGTRNGGIVSRRESCRNVKLCTVPRCRSVKLGRNSVLRLAL